MDLKPGDLAWARGYAPGRYISNGLVLVITNGRLRIEAKSLYPVATPTNRELPTDDEVKQIAEEYPVMTGKAHP